ncbi:hypothetical protein CRUP_013007 [Coryphaenoides rupestris]|nr:hypothetical protein CRUP_013007 [Coryphaenoides rupestris]
MDKNKSSQSVNRRNGVRRSDAIPRPPGHVRLRGKGGCLLPLGRAGGLMRQGLLQDDRQGLQQKAGGRHQVGGVGGRGVGHQVDFALQFDQPRQDVVQQHGDGSLQLTVAGHGSPLRPARHQLVLLGQHLDVSAAELQDLLPQLGAALVVRLLHGVAQQHEAPRQAQHHQQRTQLLGHVPPQERTQHHGPGPVMGSFLQITAPDFPASDMVSNNSPVEKEEIRYGQKFKQHKTDFEVVPHGGPLALPCQVKGCRCLLFRVQEPIYLWVETKQQRQAAGKPRRYQERSECLCLSSGLLH